MDNREKTFGYDCECGCGYQLTPEQAAGGCPQDYPELCGLPLAPRVERLCRLDVDECARRCSNKPGSCDLFGDGLEADGLGCRVAGRRVVVSAAGTVRVELDLVPGEPS